MVIIDPSDELSVAIERATEYVQLVNAQSQDDAEKKLAQSKALREAQETRDARIAELQKQAKELPRELT